MNEGPVVFAWAVVEGNPFFNPVPALCEGVGIWECGERRRWFYSESSMMRCMSLMRVALSSKDKR